MPRTILVSLAVSIDDNDPRSPEEIGHLIHAAVLYAGGDLQVIDDPDGIRDLTLMLNMAEELSTSR